MPALSSEEIHQKIVARVSDAVGPMVAAKDPFCAIKADKLQEVARTLKNDPALSFDFLEDLTATDHPKEGLIRVVYHFYSYPHGHSFVAKVEVNRSDAHVPSVEGVWKAAEWMEREVFDLFGVNFVGHSDLRRILMPYDWVGHPLRKDYSEAGGYRDITNVRDNPLDLYLNMDRRQKTELPSVAPAAEQKDQAH